MDNNCKIYIYKILEFLVMLTCIPWNFLEDSIRSGNHDVMLPK